MTHDERPRQLFESAARGNFPPPSWEVEIVAAPARVAAAVVAFTGFHLVAADVDEAELRARLAGLDRYGPMRRDFTDWLSEQVGATAGNVDVVLARTGIGCGDEWLTAKPHSASESLISQRVL